MSNDNIPLISDDLIFACQDAANEERSRWVMYKRDDGSVSCFRNRHSPGDVAAGKPDYIANEVEQQLFTNAEYARSFIQWRVLKAALEYYEQYRPKILI